MSVTLGQKLKYFRKRVGLSQLDLEMRINGAAGMLSRIESGEVNPTKETIMHIAKVLSLVDREIQYVSGILENPATLEEVEMAQKEVGSYFSKPGIMAYLVDDRYRFISASNAFKKLLKVSDSIVIYSFLKPFIILILDPATHIKDLLDSEEYENIMFNLLARFRREVGFMIDDEIYKETISVINQDPVAREVWGRVQKEEYVNLQSAEARKVTFKVTGLKVPMIYSNEPLLNNRRFEIIEYAPMNGVVNFLSKMI